MNTKTLEEYLLENITGFQEYLVSNSDVENYVIDGKVHLHILVAYLKEFFRELSRDSKVELLKSNLVKFEELLKNHGSSIYSSEYGETIDNLMAVSFLEMLYDDRDVDIQIIDSLLPRSKELYDEAIAWLNQIQQDISESVKLQKRNSERTGIFSRILKWVRKLK